jgi:uncharacterized protein (DUF302 family)
MRSLKKTEEYRAETETEAKEFIEQVKEESKSKGFYVSAYSITHKEKKAKGEVIDDCFVVKIVKTYAPIWDI